MIYEFIYFFSNAIVGINWFAFIFMPDSKLSVFLDNTKLPLAIIGVLNLGLMLCLPFDGFPVTVLLGGGPPLSIEAMMKLFANVHWSLAVWMHMAAWDLLMGSWVLHDSRSLKIPHWITSLFMVFTVLIGPGGFTIYLLSRKRLSRSSS